MRLAHKSFKSASFTVPEGDIIIAAPSMARFGFGADDAPAAAADESALDPFFQDSEQYRPDRFLVTTTAGMLKLRSKSPAIGGSKYGFVGFGGGLHACMGQVWMYRLRVRVVYG